MRQTIRLTPGRFIQLDSYGKYRKDLVGKFCVVFMSLAISIITASAVVGIDITNPNPTQHHGNTKY